MFFFFFFSISIVLVIVIAVVALIVERDMLEERPISLRQSPSRRRLLRPGVDTDDRGWTSLHVYARKGDIKLVRFFLSDFLISPCVRLFNANLLYLINNVFLI